MKESAGTGLRRGVRDTGLSAAADPGMDRFARLVAQVVDAPVALVSLIDSSRQVFPGMVGLDDPWATLRHTPLTHSLCRHVLDKGVPLILDDVRADALTCESPAIDDLGVVSYAGMPLTDADGHTLGSLCAIDTGPRHWTAREVALLEDLAAACSAELRLRIVSRQREQARRAEVRARHEADTMAARNRVALNRSQLLLRASDAFADTVGLNQVSQQIRRLVSGDLDVTFVSLALVQDGRISRLIDTVHAGAVRFEHTTYGLDAAWPSARAARENRPVVVRNQADIVDRYGAEALAAYQRLGLHTALSVPLPGATLPLGSLTVGWDHEHEIDTVEHAVFATLAGYAARAVERARFVDDRVRTARQMQEAMLTALPAVAGLELAGLYRSAGVTDLVGGDWYDAYWLPARPGDTGEREGTPAVLALSIGDISGHDLKAATLMGQTRSMLRQAGLDHAGGGPARTVTAVEHANRYLDIGASGTLVHAHLRPAAPPGSWDLTWTNAGHPPPMTVRPDGTFERLDEHDVLIHPALGVLPRGDHHRHLPPGSLLLFYTDGLVERPGADVDTVIDEVAARLTAHAREPLPDLLTGIADHVAGPSPDDDVALMALRVP